MIPELPGIVNFKNSAMENKIKLICSVSIYFLRVTVFIFHGKLFKV